MPVEQVSPTFWHMGALLECLMPKEGPILNQNVTKIITYISLVY